jgi:23S rRNA (uracil1939-C5)-methyltransferase
MGQGVSKIGDKIIFIPKTLPGEEGLCEVLQSKKGVEFAKLSSIELPSPDRVRAECPHFEDCPSCHYLHTSYANELLHKKNAIQKELRPITIQGEIEVIPADTRFDYRNRIQLHYDLNEEKIGYIDVKNKRINEVPHCLLPQKIIQEKVKSLYQNKFKGFPQKRETGHIEIYVNSKTNRVETAFNKAYAHAGFTQVNFEMNEKALSLIHSYVAPKINKTSLVIDLFGGKGNLSRAFSTSNTYVVDKYHPKYIPKNDIQKFINLDIFKKKSHKNLAKQVGGECDVLLIDPPRSGFKNIKLFTDVLKPKVIVYMSCKTSTMVRDLLSIDNEYHFHKAHLLDFFPATYHYESLIFANFK